jgi:hypothetical protein
LVDPDHCYNGFKDADENGSDCGGGCKKACVRQTSGGAAWVSDKVSEKKWEKRGEKRGETREEYGIRVFLTTYYVCVLCVSVTNPLFVMPLTHVILFLPSRLSPIPPPFIPPPSTTEGQHPCMEHTAVP